MNQSDSCYNPTLGELLRQTRKERGWSQKQVEQRVPNNPHAPLSVPALSAFERGERVPSTPTTIALARALSIDVRRAIALRLADVLAGELPGEEEDPLIGEARLVIRDLRAMPSGIRQPARGATRSERSLRTFPQAFPDLVVVTGDKREVPPKTPGDIGAYSASPIDDRWGYALRLPPETEKVSDKEFVTAPHEELEERYGQKNILVIGSPASNHLARLLSRGCVFPFNLQPNHLEDLDRLMEELRESEDQQELAAIGADHQDELKRIMRWFYAYGIIDPVRQDVVGYALPPDKDYATLSLARNPFSPEGQFEHVCILAAGFHHPGTIMAVRYLSEPANFSDRPLGGVLEVSIDTNLKWERRMRSIEAAWETPEYTFEAVLDGIERLPRLNSALVNTAGVDWSACARLVAAVRGDVALAASRDTLRDGA